MFSGIIDTSPGWHTSILSNLTGFYCREMIQKIDDIHPKDKDGILFKDFHLSMVYQISPQHAVHYLLQANDVVTENNIKVLGENRIDRDARNVLGETMRKFSSMDVLNDQVKVENTFKEDLQKDLDLKCGNGTFIIKDIKMANIMFNDTIETRIQSIANTVAGKAKAEAIISTIEAREKGLKVGFNAYNQAAIDAHVPIDLAIEIDKLKVIIDHAGGLNINISSTPRKP
jgi:hypothetical protein